MDLSPIWISLELALLTCTILLVIGVPLAFWLHQTKFRGKLVLDALFSIPLILPPSVLGFYLLILFSPKSIVGEFMLDELGLRLAFTFPGLVIASLISSLPFMLYPLRSGFNSLPKTYFEAAAAMGLNQSKTLWKIMIPNIRPQITIGLALTFAHVMGEFGVLMMISGSKAGETKVASIAIWEAYQSMDYQTAHQLSAVLVGSSLLVILLLFFTNRKWAMRT